MQGWETAALSVACEGDYCAPPPLPPSRLLLHNTQRLRLTRTYQVISGQADLTLMSLPRASQMKTLSLLFVSLSVSCSCKSIPLPHPSRPLPLFFICLSSVHTDRPGRFVSQV